MLIHRQSGNPENWGVRTTVIPDTGSPELTASQWLRACLNWYNYSFLWVCILLEAAFIIPRIRQETRLVLLTLRYTNYGCGLPIAHKSTSPPADNSLGKARSVETAAISSGYLRAH